MQRMQRELEQLRIVREPDLDELQRARTGEEASRAELLAMVHVVHDERRAVAGELEWLTDHNRDLEAQPNQLHVEHFNERSAASHPPTQTHRHTQTHALTHAHTHTHTHTYTRTHTRAHTRARAHTHTNTWT